MNYTVSSTKTLVTSLVLSALAALIVCGLWALGLLAPLQSLFLISAEGNSGFVQAQTWLAILMILGAGVCTGFLVARAGLHRALFFIVVLLFLWLGLSLLVSRLLQFDVLFAPAALSSLFAMIVVQANRLWSVDNALSQSIQQVASQTHVLEGGEANTRLVSGLRLLETVLPLEEAVIFQPDEQGNLAPAARLRQAKSPIATHQQNVAWREGVGLCERAVEKEELQFEMGRGGVGANVALPLNHGERSVGALLVRLKEPFDESDRPLLAAVGEQIARSFQRNETRKRQWAQGFMNFISVRAAQHRFDAFGVVSGLLTEQRFGSQVVAETSDGQAIAYLDGTIASINAPMLRFARMTQDAAKQTDIFGLLGRFRSEYFDEPALAVRRVLQTGEPYEREVPFPDFEQTLSVRVALAKEEVADGETTRQPLCFSITVRDVTGLKEYRKLKSDMVSLMSHELRTPITSINGFAELLALEDDIPESAREFVEIISNESQRLSRMIDTFLSVSKLEQKDKQEVLTAPVKLNEVVREVLMTMQDFARSKRIRLVEHSIERMPPVAADRGMILQVVTNLVDNAIRYSPERTVVNVSTILEIDHVRVTVEDRGYGIPHESLDKIWEKFYRVSREGMDKEDKSTGLGLTFVKEVVEQHGGGVSVMSDVGKGSVFSFTLPRL